MKNILVALNICLFQYISENVYAMDEMQKLDEEIRIKRQLYGIPLVYPYGGTYKLVIGIGFPIPNDDHVSLAFGANLQYQYSQFSNITQLSQYYAYNTVSRDQRSLDLEHRKDERLVFYKSIETIMNMKGMDGRECVLRAICEAAQYPVEDEGLIGEILHILLTPNYGRSPFDDDVDDEEWKESMTEYINAYTAGRQMFSCPYIYSRCPEGEGILEMISVLRDE